MVVSGVYLKNCNDINFYGTTFIKCSMHIEDATTKPQATTYKIDTSNKVNDKSIYYYKNSNMLDHDDFTDPGQIILANCNSSIISGFSFKSGSDFIVLMHSNGINITNNHW